MPTVQTLRDAEFSDYGLGGTVTGAEAVGSDLANTMLGGPAQGGAYTGGIGGGSSRTEEERQQSILDVNPYVRPGENINPNPVTSQRNSGQTGYYFANELGLPASYGNVGAAQAADPATFNPNAQYVASLPGFVPVNPNATYRLVSGGADGDVVYSGTGAEGLRNVFVQANDLTLADPKNAYWGVEVLDPATGQYNRVAENRGPNGLGIVGDIAGIALPIAAAIATGGASLGIQIAAGAAAGGLGGFLSGNDILDSALVGGLTAGLSGAGGKYAGRLLETGGALGTNVGAGLSRAIGTGVGTTTAGLITGQSLEDALLSGAVSGGLSYYSPQVQAALDSAGNAINEAFDGINVRAPVTTGGVRVGGGGGGGNSQASNTGDAAGTVVTGGSTTGGVNISGIGGTGGNTGTTTTTTRPAETTAEEERPGTVVTGGSTTGGVNISGIGGTGGNTGTTTTTTRPAETTAEEERPGTVVTGGSTTGGVNISGIGGTGRLGDPTSLLPDNFFDDPERERSTLDQLRDAARLAQTAATVGGLVAAAVGGSTGGSGTGVSSNGGTYDATSNRSDTFGTRNVANISFDPFTYGQATGNQPGEFMFFTRNPVTGATTTTTAGTNTAAAAGTNAATNAGAAGYVNSGNTFAEGGEINDDMVSHLIAYHKNGGHTGPGQVKGIGSGQEDKIPAWLSDGEYVWSAQDVADLGDGSTDEGVRRLDKMRKMVRRRAGRKDVKKIAKPQKGIDHMLKAVGGSN
jgi:hypothetical protein